MNNESGHGSDNEFQPNSSQFEPENDPGADGGRSMGLWMMLGFWAMIFGFGFLGARHYLAEQAKANPPHIVATKPGDGPAIAIDASRRGHYTVEGLVNGHPVSFLIDTGATLVSIPEHVAEQIGLQKGEAGLAITANGYSTVYDANVDTLEIGPLRQVNVAASISPGLTSDEALLGMSFLRHFTLVQVGDQLQIQTP